MHAIRHDLASPISERDFRGRLPVIRGEPDAPLHHEGRRGNKTSENGSWWRNRRVHKRVTAQSVTALETRPEGRNKRQLRLHLVFIQASLSTRIRCSTTRRGSDPVCPLGDSF